MVHPPEHPNIAVTPTVLGNPDIHLPNNNLPNWGDPLGKGTNDSMGQGHGNGVGNGNGNGVGPGEGYGHRRRSPQRRNGRLRYTCLPLLPESRL